MTQWGLDTLFNPAKRHMDEEKRRLQSTREEVGDNSGGKRVDLESGRVTIRRDEKDGDQSDTGEGAVEVSDPTDAPRTDETPAMRRARLRRSAPKPKPKSKPTSHFADAGAGDTATATSEPTQSAEPDATER